MTRPIRIVLKFAAAAALIASTFLAANLSPRRGTPYASALSRFSVSVALAAPGCEMKICSKPKGNKRAACIQSTFAYNCSGSGGVCTATPC